MIDYKPELIEALSTVGLPVHYELLVDSSTKTPCITYQECENNSYAEGDTLLYSTLSFYIKLWGDDLNVLAPKAQEVAEVMRLKGFKRTNYQELWYGSQICIIIRFTATGLESFN